MTTLASLYGLATHYTAITHPSEPNYLALIGGSTFGYTSDGNCCFMISSPNIVDRLESAGLTWQAFAEDAGNSGTCSFSPPRSGDHFPFIDFSDMNTASRCSHFLTTSSPTDTKFLAALNSTNPANYIWLTPNDSDNCHNTTVSLCDAYLSALVPLILSSIMFTTQRSELFIVFDEGKDYCPIGNSSSDCVYAAWIGPLAKKAFISSSAYSHYSYLHTLEANWNLATLTSNDAGAATMAEFFGTSQPPALSGSFTYDPATPVVGTSVSFSGSASGGTSPYTYSWRLGDGATGTGSSATHVYSSAGTFNVILTVSDSGSPQQTSTSLQTLTIPSPPPALTTSFSYTPSSPEAGQNVTFTASASGGATPYNLSWSFGDGTSGTNNPTTRSYSSSGSFMVSVTTTDANGMTTISSQTITIASALAVSFTFTPATAEATSPMTFTSRTTGAVGPFTLNWTFGDGSTTNTNPATHSYTKSGSFTVTVTATDTNGVNATSNQTIKVASALAVSFTESPASPQVNLAETFIATITGGVGNLGYTWTFGDGGTSTVDPATYTYTTAGTYQVSVTAIDSDGVKTTSSRTITVTATLIASFTYSPPSSNVGQTVSFSASASGGEQPYSYSWSFGDGSTGTESTATHIYSSTGTFTVVLTVNDSGSPQQTATSQQSIIVTSPPPPPLTASLTCSATSPLVGQQVTFSASTSGGIAPYSFSWSFGDGSTGTGSTASHSYSIAGTFTVTLTVNDSSTPQQTAASQQSVIVSNPLPSLLTSSFTYSASSPEAGQQVTFTGTASGGTTPYSFSWSFGDGGLSMVNPASHIYSSPGSFTVTLTATDSNGVNASSSQIIVVAPTFTVGFANGPASPEAGQPVAFTATESGGVGNVSFTWAFGDNSSSNENPAMHTYTTSGSFLVSVTATDADGVSTTSDQTVTVAASLGASLTFSPSSPHAGDIISFIASVSGGIQPYNYSWSFGDSTTGSGSPVSHIYQSDGSYTVTLIVTDANNQTANTNETMAVKHRDESCHAHADCVWNIFQTVNFNAIESSGAALYVFNWIFASFYNPSGLGGEIGVPLMFAWESLRHRR